MIGFTLITFRDGTQQASTAAAVRMAAAENSVAGSVTAAPNIRLRRNPISAKEERVPSAAPVSESITPWRSKTRNSRELCTPSASFIN